MNENMIDTSCIKQKYWDDILTKDGLGKIDPISTELKKNDLEGTSLETAQQKEEEIKTGLDMEVATENNYSSAAPMNKSGLLPCQRAKHENEANIRRDDARLRT
jgi:hypothetical protein